MSYGNSNPKHPLGFSLSLPHNLTLSNTLILTNWQDLYGQVESRGGGGYD